MVNYVAFAKWAGKIVKASPYFKDPRFEEAIDLLGWDIGAREVNAAAIITFFLSIMGSAIAVLFFIFFFPLPFQLLIVVLPILFLIPIALTFYVQNYPLIAAKNYKMRALLYLPEFVNYVVMYLKLSPNLERAFEFAAKHGKGPLAKDVERMLFDVKMGLYTIEEAIDRLAYKWGAVSDEFKHAMMLVRSSIIEPNEARRYALLDKALSDVMIGVKEDMEAYAREMRQPSIYLYYFGILLPMLLIIMLPVGSAIAGLPLAQTWVEILLFNIVIPFGAFFFAKAILSKRPPVYEPPKIPDNYPGIRKGWIKIGKSYIPAFITGLILAVAIYFTFSYVLEPILNPLPPEWMEEARANYVPIFHWAGIIVGGAVFVSFILLGSASEKRRVQKEIMEMENEFEDAIYLVASRLGENRPVEEAFEYTANFLSAYKVSRIFRDTVKNIRGLGLTLESALFDGVYGSLRWIPSSSIRGAMRILVNSVGLGVQQAARALVSLSVQIREMRKLKQFIANILSEITSMMKSVAFFIAPIVLGITTALQNIILSALRSMTQIASPQTTGFLPVEVPKLFRGIKEGGLTGVPSTPTFFAIMILYVIEIVLILIYFTSRVDEGENPLHFRISLAKTLPIALLLFFLSAWFAMSMTATI